MMMKLEFITLNQVQEIFPFLLKDILISIENFQSMQRFL
jgi:hypothetical protein